jgi:hypothetical protein
LVEEVKPAYGRVIALMQAQQRVAPTDDGIWRFSNGADQYAALLRNYTTTDMNADQIHTLGLQQVARIHGEMRAVQQRIGFRGTLPQFFQHMRTRKENFFPNTPAGRQAYLDETDRVMAAMQARLPEYFSERATPRAPLTVKAVEPFREKSAGKAFYQRPTPDGSRPGTYYVNLYDMADMPHIELEALAFHEGVPGHHLDGSVTSQLNDIPPFRRFGGYTAWSEGWGLYAEKLGKDMGFYTDPYRDFGGFSSNCTARSAWSSTPGLHHKRWTRQQAIDYVQNNSADAPAASSRRSSATSCSPARRPPTWSAASRSANCATARSSGSGNRFDMRGFHDAVLLNGAVPLDVMERNVDAWIASRQPPKILPGTGRGTMRSMVEGALDERCASWEPTPSRLRAPPPRPGEDLVRPQHKLPQAARIMQRVMRHAAILRRAEPRRAQKLHAQPADLDDLRRPGHQQRAQMRQILRPVRHHQRIRVGAEITRKLMRGLLARHRVRIQPRRDGSQIGQHMPLHPVMHLRRQWQHRIIFLVAMFRHQRDADQLAAKAIIFRIEKIAHRPPLLDPLPGREGGPCNAWWRGLSIRQCGREAPSTSLRPVPSPPGEDQPA